MVIVESAGITDRGKKRAENEDALFLDDTLGLYVVADGMGGHQAGEIASQLVVATISDYVREARKNGASAHAVIDRTLSPEANQLLGGIRLSNELVHRESINNDSYRGMGSTVSAVYFSDGTAIAANVGDSPIYLIRDRKIKLLSVEHTVFAEQMACDPENAEVLAGQFKHVLTRAMGTEQDVKADIYEIQCFPGDILVISSDGLSDKATPAEIMETVAGIDLDAGCRRLVELANARGGDDNITAIVLKIKSVEYRGDPIGRILGQTKRKLIRLIQKSTSCKKIKDACNHFKIRK